MCFAALAGGMGWGIRGQYGHETGAMLAGLLVALVVVYFFAYQFSSIDAAKAVALATVAIGFGGSMTYGQTLGLTQDPPLIGNIAAFRWGLIGIFIKGSIWIGFFGLFLGLGLGGKKYSPIEIILILFVSVFFVLVSFIVDIFENLNRFIDNEVTNDTLIDYYVASFYTYHQHILEHNPNLYLHPNFLIQYNFLLLY